MQSIRTPRTQAVRGPCRPFTGRDIDQAEASDGLRRGIRSAIPYAVTIWAIAFAVWTVGPQVQAATAGMP